MDNLARNAMLASQAGMSYGQWKALHPVTLEQKDIHKPDPKERVLVCPNCGKTFTTKSWQPNKKYCDDFCRSQMQGKSYRSKAKAVESYGET